MIYYFFVMYLAYYLVPTKLSVLSYIIHSSYSLRQMGAGVQKSCLALSMCFVELSDQLAASRGHNKYVMKMAIYD